VFDVFALYNRPDDVDLFNEHYASVHAPLTRKMPGLQEFVWGVAESDTDLHVVARMTFADEASADAGLGSPEGKAAVDDLANFADAGVTILRVPRH